MMREYCSKMWDGGSRVRDQFFDFQQLDCSQFTQYNALSHRLLQSVCCRWSRDTTTPVYLIGPLRRKIYSFFGRGQTSVFEKIEKNLRWDWQQRSRTSSQFIFIFKITWEEASQPGLRRSRLLVDTTGLRMCARRVAMSRKKPIFFQVKMMRQSTK